MTGWNRLAKICKHTAAAKMTAKIAVPTRYPRFIDIETASPPVSPSVVAAILISQNPTVACGTLLAVFAVTSSLFITQFPRAGLASRSSDDYTYAGHEDMVIRGGGDGEPGARWMRAPPAGQSCGVLCRGCDLCAPRLRSLGSAGGRFRPPPPAAEPQRSRSGHGHA